MRIISGKSKGRQLSAEGCGKARPTSGRARAALFDSMGAFVADAFFVDWCAGTGAVGLEALSRGAAKVLFVEANKGCFFTLLANLKALGLQEQGECWLKDIRVAARQMAGRGLKADVLFADPPYQEGFIELIAELISKYSPVADDGMIVLQLEAANLAPESLGEFNLRRTMPATGAVFAFYAKGDQ